MTTKLDVHNKQRPVLPSYRYFFFFAIVFGGSFFIISIRYGTEFRILNHEIVSVTNLNRDHISERSQNRFTIQTEGCTISAIDPFDANIKKYVKYPSKVKPCLFSNISLLESNDTHIWTVKDNLFYYNISEYATLNCCYKSFQRPNLVNDINSKYIDDRVLYNDCLNFSDVIQVHDEFVMVTCSNTDVEVYEQFFLFPVKKPSKKKKNVKKMTNETIDYNVIIMGIDAVSRMNFYRTMPKTLSYLKNKGAVELLGYNKVGDNSFPNLSPLLMGINEKDLKRTCLPNDHSTFDNCPFIWEWFKEKGYYTALGEDSAKLGTFNYCKVGFGGTPTDYYLYTFMHESERHVGNNLDFNSFLCMGDKYYYQVLLDYIEKLTTLLKFNRLFGFFWEVTMSHDYLNYPMLMDESYEQFIKHVDESGYLNDTILILLSDHGIRWGDIRKTKQGRLEERLPFVYILPPSSFRTNYENAYNNLRSNSKKLTTPYDVHEMLSDLTDMNTIKDEMISVRTTGSYAKNRGISLFLPIPGNRTCKEAGIDDHWCTCHKGRKLSTEDKAVIEASQHLMSYLNFLLHERPQCARLVTSEIIDATEMEITGAVNAEKSWRELTIVVRVDPGDAVFEATLRYDEEWTVAGGVSRLNLYGDKSRCVDDYRLKLYCYCQ